MSFYAVIWRYTDDTSVIDGARAGHGAYLKELVGQGKLKEAGPFVDGTGGVLVVEAAGQDELKTLLDGDPYVSEGVVVDQQVVEWKPVIGPFAG
ncbi:YciI family protein [Pseudonocardia acidicola]|uniref:YCII-related domain-containing protein n=1 Tax=Pseudonocardia acidicola TaxID=2724939 RepID=A0ABX1S307_9PSEU|nr:YciI family protein [Pseudonocardia acidicola]NMH95933.1 hypothetical protein [Pseudonocardia acidicola]